MAGLDKYIEEYNKSKGGTGTSSSQDEEKNKGGFWGGAEYLGTRFVDGFVSNIEGILDFAVGGVAGLIGLSGNENAQEFAEDVFRDDWYNYERADDKYNPGKGMSVLGDVAGVVGGAVPDVAIGLLTGGAGTAAKLISAGTSIASSAGRGLNEAVDTTGNLGAKEWAGGIGGGLLAGGIELISGGLGNIAGGAFGKTGVEMGSELAESLGKKASNETIESIFNKAIGKEAAGEFSESAIGRLVSNIWNSKAFRDLAGEMTSEGLEESIETWLEPFIKQNTYQPDAPNASAGDILYSGFLGAVSGGIISGGVNATNDIITTKRGATIANNNNKLTSLFDNAQAIIGYENKNDTGSQVFGAVSNMYQDIQNKLQQSGGKMTVSIMNDIGKLDALVGSAVMQPSIVNAAKGVAKNAESMAESLNRFYKQTGQSKRVTAEQLTAGLNLDGSSKDFVKSVTNALETNATLREVVLNNMFGRLQFDAKAYANSIYGDIDIRSIATQQNLNRFISSADAATLGQTGEVLGISDWASLTPEELASKIQQFRQNGGEAAFAEGISAVKEAQKAKGYTKGMPNDISALKQGATRFKVGGADFAIIRHGDSYRLYDYNTGHITKSVQMGDMNSLVARLRERADQIGKESEMQALDREIDSFAMENVPEYKSLTAAEKEAVRATLRYAQASGISMKDQILFARIAAKSGINIIPGKNLLDNKAAWYDGINTIYIDTTTPRTRLYSGILGHELYHKMFKSDKRRKLFNAAFKNIDQKLKDNTKENYIKQLREEGRYTEEQIEAISDEEVAAAYAEELFNTPGVWSFILDGEPNLGERVINFFKGSPKRYSFAPEMDPAAKAWIREYKKLFDEVARFNAGENVATSVRKIERIGRLMDDSVMPETYSGAKAITRVGKVVENDEKTSLTNMNQENMHVSDGRAAINEEFEERLDRWDKKTIGFSFVVGETSTALQEAGIPRRQIRWDASKIATLLNKHQGMSIDVIKQIPQLLESPVIVIDSKKSPNAKIVMGDLYDSNNKVVTAVLLLTPTSKKGNVLELIKISSAEGRGHIKSLFTYDDGTTVPIRYVDKKRIQSWLNVNRLQLPLHNLDSDSNKSISQNSQNSNAFDKNSAKDFKTDGRSALLTDKEKAYKEKVNAKAEAKIAKAEAKAEKLIETERTKLKAEYETDRVFSQAEVNKSLATVEAFKSLPKKVRDSISNQVWTAFSESNGYDSRSWLELKYTAELTDRIIRERDTSITKYERDAIFDQVNAAMKQIAEGGKKSVRANMESEIRNEVTPKIKAEESTRRVVYSQIYQSLKKINDVKTQRFAAASDYKGRTFKGSIERLTKMDWRGQLNDKIVRSEMTEILKWYQPDNPMLKELENSELRTTMYDESIKHRLEVLAEGEGALTNTELGMLSDSLAYFTKLINEYDQVYIEGKWQSGEHLVYKMIDTIKKQDQMRMPLAIKGLRNRFLSGDFKAFGDPLSVMKAADMYEDGIFVKYYNEWMWGEINAQAEELSIKQEYNEFMKKNKNYVAKAEETMVKLHDVEFNKMQLISYIMTLKRKGSWLGAVYGGEIFRDKNGRDVNMRALTPIAEGDGFNKKLQNAIEAERALAESLLTDKDKQYIEILERGFEKAKATKAAADMQRLGFVNVVDGYYYPLRRAYTEHLSEFEAELFTTDRYANASFNKKSIEKAKSALLIISADTVFNNHVKGVSRYMYLSPVIDSFNKLYKLKVLKTKPGLGADIGALYALPGSTTSMQQTIAQAKSTWRQDGKIVGFDYLQNLMLDTMSSKPQAIGDDVTGWFRSNYVGFALGANPKVLLTQLSSLFASTSVINVGSHIGGIFTNARDVDTYSVVARLRDSDYTIAKAMSVSDNVSRLSKWLTQGMSFFDRLVVKRTYAAAKVQVSREQGLKIGTEENRIAAGKLLDKVILETQQNAMSSRKTEAARRGNMLSKTMIMFKSDAITTMGRVIDAWGELQYLEAKKKSAEGDGKGEYKAQIKKAKKQLSRTIGAVVAGSAYMVIVSEAFKKFYGKDDEDETDEEKAKRRFGEFILNVMGGLPVISSIAEAFTSFYDFESIEFSAINDILSTAKKIGELASDLLDGKADSRDVNRLIERLMFTAGQIFGIPTRNIKNLVYAITRLISPETAYKWNDSLYDQSYKGDLTDALEKGDYDMAEVILELAFGDKMGGGLSDRAIAELMRLANIGEDIIPSAIGDTITIDGVERELTGEELKAVREKYGEAIDRINYIVDTDVFKSFSDETKADAVRKIYSLYKNLAYDGVLGTKKDEEAYILSKIVEPDILCLNEILTCYTSDKDEDGNTIPNSKRKKVVAAIQDMDISDEEKLLLIATHGYALKDGDVSGMSKEKADAMLYDYIAGLDISDEEKLALYKYCGYDVKDGEVSGSAASGSSSSGNGSKENGSGSTSGSSGSKKTSGGSRKSSYKASLTNPSGPLSKVTQNRVRRIGKIV